MRKEHRKKQEAKERAAKALQETKRRLGIKPARSLQGVKKSSHGQGLDAETRERDEILTTRY
jgi:hypothetical protein